MLHPRGLSPYFSVLVVIILSAPLLLVQLEAQPKPGCTSRCGDLNIPYPFGTSHGRNDCYHDGESDSFRIFCDNSSGRPVAYWSFKSSNIIVDHISLEDSEMRIKMFVAKDCYSPSGSKDPPNSPSLWTDVFPISSTKNR